MTTPSDPISAIDRLRSLTGHEWPNIRAASEAADVARTKLAAAINGQGLVPLDTSLVVFGSLARREYTPSSDCDWTLLIDGQANGDHLRDAQEIRRAVKKLGMKGPGPTELFGSLAFSHPLVHDIGGEDDTNRNTTRRVLLLLESAPIDSNESVFIRDRVIKQILFRYIENEADLIDSSGTRRIPRFLLNDIVRYWRTMAVDYAKKIRDREGDGWALRNIKLRMSRKLLFVAGMIMCFDCKLRPRSINDSLFNNNEWKWLPVFEQLRASTEVPPLETLAGAICNYANDDKERAVLAGAILDAYDEFLGVLSDESMRKVLTELRPEVAEDDSVFSRARNGGKQSQQGLLQLFFETNVELAMITKEFGVF